MLVVGLVRVLALLQCSSVGIAVLPAAPLAERALDNLLVEARTLPAVVHMVAVRMQAGQVAQIGFGSSHRHTAAAGACHTMAVAVAPAAVPDTRSLRSAVEILDIGHLQVAAHRVQSLHLLQTRMLVQHKRASFWLQLRELEQLVPVAHSLRLVLQGQADHPKEAVVGSP